MKERKNEKENGMKLICKLVQWEIGARLLQKNTKQNSAWLECSVLILFLTMSAWINVGFAPFMAPTCL